MRPEKRHLIHDLLDGQPDARREATLLAGGRILRRRRWRRVAVRSFTLAAIAGAAVLSLERLRMPRQIAHTAPPPSVQTRELTDDQLLALFPDTPVGLATLADGRKRLIFPRPGDQQKFVTRL